MALPAPNGASVHECSFRFFLVLFLFSASFLSGFALAFAPRPSVFAESPEGCPGVCASRVALPLLPFAFAFWWLRLAPRGCSVFLA